MEGRTELGAQRLEPRKRVPPLKARVAMTTAVRAVDAQGLSIATHPELRSSPASKKTKLEGFWIEGL